MDQIETLKNVKKSPPKVTILKDQNEYLKKEKKLRTGIKILIFFISIIKSPKHFTTIYTYRYSNGSDC